MKKTWKRCLLPLMAAAALTLWGCGKQTAAETETAQAETETEAVTETEESAADAEQAEAAETADGAVIRVGSLKGPTTMGLVNLMNRADNGELPFDAEFTMAAAADEITAKLVQGDLDVALVPANLASVLYNKTEGGVAVMNINTMGVLYGVTGDESVKGLSDLAGKTVYMTGQGTTPEYAFRYILAQNGMSDAVTIEFKSEATEIAALMKEDPSIIAVLPQPFATVCQIQNESVKEFMNLTEEWDKCAGSDGSRLLTGVTIVRKAFLEAQDLTDENNVLVQFAAAQKESAEAALADVDATAELVVKYGILEKAPIAKAALPKCSIVCVTGDEMKAALSGYLQVLFDADAKSVGGKLPGDDFYLSALN